MRTIEFSIIIPVYNAENSLDRCLRSILNQSFPNFEVILVDDGSTDNSNGLCRSYVDSDTRFKLFSQQNQGPSAARNQGLDVAKGNYIVFVDSDDYIEVNFLEILKTAFGKRDADVVFIGYSEYSIKGELLRECIPSQNILEYGYFETLIKLAEENMFGYTWIKSFNRKVIGNIRFSTNIMLFEDEIFTCQVLQKCNKVETANKPIYNYITGNPQALTKRTYQNYCTLQDKVFLEWQKLLCNYDNKETVLNMIAGSFVSRSIYYGFEKNINPRKYFDDLANCEFFKISKVDSKVTSYIRAHKSEKLMMIRWKYRVKWHISHFIKQIF